MGSSPARSAAVWGDPTGCPTEFDPNLVKSLPACGEVRAQPGVGTTEFGQVPSPLAGRSGRSPGWGAPTLVYSRFVPQRSPLVKGVVVEPLPNGVYRVELENGAKILAHVADRAGTCFTRLLAGEQVGVELASTDRSRGRIRVIWR